jgi:hypothetical protein
MHPLTPVALPEHSIRFRRARRALFVSVAIAIGNIFVWLYAHDLVFGLGWFTLLAFLQAAVALYALVEAIRGRLKAKGSSPRLIVFSIFSLLAAGLGWLWGLVSAFFISSSAWNAVLGGAWGRPLRVRGRQLHPALRVGSDWTRGEGPDLSGLDPATRRALAALWLHDAQKEHASVPAFARISWLLAAVGAPPELLRWAHRAAIEEIEHAERCFALAAGYGGERFTVEPMPELFEGMGRIEDPLSTLVFESITDGGQLEDFNADVAARCAVVCEAPATRALLEQIAREERSHADLSWALVEWVANRDPDRARVAASRAVAELDRYPRPTAVSTEKQRLVDRADSMELRRHGRIDDSEWQAAWGARLELTRARVADIFTAAQAA